MKITLHVLFIGIILSIIACNPNNPLNTDSPDSKVVPNEVFRPGGGSSGMEQIGDHAYLAVYDLKSFEPGYRMSMIKVTTETLEVLPITIETWDEGGISSDLESICAIPGTANEFLIAESGNWQGKLGRIFHIAVDTTTLTANVLGSVMIPLLNRNDFNLVGDQYEAILCLPYDTIQRIVVLGERGGSAANPNGLIRWGIFNIKEHSLQMSGTGLEGIVVQAPGNWTNIAGKRDITDFYLDAEGIIWAAGCEDQGDLGPFYSIIYKLGKVNYADMESPILVFDKTDRMKEINGFKIESLSGPCKGINSTLSFGTEDEIYGGVWRPILLNF